MNRLIEIVTRSIEVKDLRPGMLVDPALVRDLLQREEQRIRHEERERAVVLVEQIMSAQLKIDRLLNALANWSNRIGDVAIVAGRGVTLRTYLQSHAAHDKLIGRLDTLNTVIRTYATAGLPVLDPDDMALAEVNTAIHQLATLVDLIERGEDNGGKLLSWIAEHGPDVIQDAIETMKDKINQGGHESETWTDLMVSIAEPIRARGKNWRTVLIETHRRLRTLPSGEPGRDEALNLLESAGNFWDSRQPGYSRHALKIKQDYLSKLVKRRDRRQRGGDHKML